VALKTIGNYTEDGNLGFSLGLGLASTSNPSKTLKIGGETSTSVPPFFHSCSKGIR
jgi:hypothetical protein